MRRIILACCLGLSFVNSAIAANRTEPLIKFGLFDFDMNPMDIAPEEEEAEVNPPLDPDSDSKFKIEPIEQSMVPGITCPITDGRMHRDLVKAAENLASRVTIVKQCSEESQGGALTNLSERMIDNGKAIRDLVADLTALTNDKSKQTELSNRISDFLNNFESVGDLLAKNAVLNSDCGRKQLKSGGFLVAVSDLVQAVTPFILTAASVNPALAGVAKFVVGIAGSGTVAQVLGALKDKNAIDIEDAPTREALLQNVCEYYRIVKRARSFSQAKLGDTSAANFQLQQIDTLRQTAQDKLPPAVIQRLSASTFDDNMTDVADSVSKQYQELADVRNQVLKSSNVAVNCSVSRVMAKSYSNKESLAHRILENYTLLLKNQTKPTIQQLAFIEAEQTLREKIVSEAKYNSAGSLKACAKDGVNYIDTLAQILTNQQKTVRELRHSFVSQLMEDNDLREYVQLEKSLQSEELRIKVLLRIAKMHQSLGKNNTAIDDAEIATQLRGIKYALFRPASGWGPSKWTAVSPALAWLKFMEGELEIALHRFQTDLGKLRTDAFNEGRKLPPATPRDAALRKSIPTHIVEEAARHAKTLSPINLKDFPKGSKVHGQMCNRLWNIWYSWDSTWNYLASQYVFCAGINEIIDSDFEHNLAMTCQGTTNLFGEGSGAKIVRNKERMMKRMRPSIELVISKIYELQCDGQ